MIRLILFFISVAAIAWGLSWLADRPGQILINWQGREVEITVFHTVIGLVVLLGATILSWSVLRYIMGGPSRLVDLFRRRKQAQGMDALSTGIIAVGSGDRELANRYATQARRALPHEPLTELLRAQAASLSGDRVTAHRIYEAMLSAPDTEILGLRGLFLEAREEGAEEAARQFAERALRINPKLEWPATALFGQQCKVKDWAAALETLAIARRNGHVEKSVAERRRAVLLTAQAQSLEDQNMDEALKLAQEAHKLAPDLVPAAEIAGRVLASKGQTKKSATVLSRTWRKQPHPDLAVVYAYARPGDSPKDRMLRVKQLAQAAPHSVEAPIAVAMAAIEAHDWDVARHALRPMLETKLSQRVCALMARIEDGEHGDRGRVREWLARAVTAPRDPAWTADGVVADRWAPVSPVTGEIDAFEWKVPVEKVGPSSAALALDDLLPLAVAADETRAREAVSLSAARADDPTIQDDEVDDPAPDDGPGSKAKDVTPAARTTAATSATVAATASSAALNAKSNGADVTGKDETVSEVYIAPRATEEASRMSTAPTAAAADAEKPEAQAEILAVMPDDPGVANGSAEPGNESADPPAAQVSAAATVASAKKKASDAAKRTRVRL